MSTPSMANMFFYGVQGGLLATRPSGFGGPLANTTYSFGDTHGNAIALARYFYNSGIIQFTDAEFQALTDIYDVDNNKDDGSSRLTAEQLTSFRRIIRKGFSEISLKAQVRYRCFGDLVGDRGSNDILSFIIFDELRKKYPNSENGASPLLLTILQSNHDKSLLLNYLLGRLQPGEKLHLEIYPEQCCSLLRLKDLINRGVVSYAEVDRMIQKVYLPALKLVDYVSNEDGSIDVMSHAPLSLLAIDDVMRRLLPKEQHKDIYASVNNLVAVLDQLNARYQPKRDSSGQLVFDEDIYQAIIAPPVTGLLDRFMWPRLAELQQGSAPRPSKYKICFRHGHDGKPGAETIIHGIRYVGYNNEMGKATLDAGQIDAGQSVISISVLRPTPSAGSDPASVIAQLEKKLTTATAERDNAIAAARDVFKQAGAAEAKIAELEQAAAAATHAHEATMKAERTAAAARAEAEQIKITVLARELEAAKAAARTATIERDTAQSRIAQLEQAVTAVTTERNNAIAVSETATSRAGNAQSRITQLERAVAAANTERDKAIEAAQTATTRAGAVQTRVAQLDRELAAAKVAARTATIGFGAAAQARIVELERAVAAANTERDKAIEAAQTRVAQLDRELAAAKVVAQTRVAQLDRELAAAKVAAQTRIAQLDRELAAAKVAAQTRITELEQALTAARAAERTATASVRAAQTNIRRLEQDLIAERAAAQVANDQIACAEIDTRTATARTADAEARAAELEQQLTAATAARDAALATASRTATVPMPLPTRTKKERSGVFAKVLSIAPWKMGMYTGFAVTAIVGTGLAVYFIAPFAVPVIITNITAVKAAILKFALEHTFLLPIVNTLVAVTNFSAQLLAPLVNLLTNFVNLLANIVISGSTTEMVIGIKSLALTAGSGLSAGLVTTAVAQATTQTLNFFRARHKPSYEPYTQATSKAIKPLLGNSGSC